MHIFEKGTAKKWRAVPLL